jgi:hypothetical protein
MKRRPQTGGFKHSKITNEKRLLNKPGNQAWKSVEQGGVIRNGQFTVGRYRFTRIRINRAGH